MSLDTGEIRVVRAWHWRLLPFTITQGFEGCTVKAFSAIGALRKVTLIPGAKVKVWVPVIVSQKRVRTARKLYKAI